MKNTTVIVISCMLLSLGGIASAQSHWDSANFDDLLRMLKGESFESICKSKSTRTRECYMTAGDICICQLRAAANHVNPLHVLNLSSDATAKEIKSKCKKLLVKYHRDKGGSDDISQKINAACDDLDWRGQDSCKTNDSNVGASCMCPTPRKNQQTGSQFSSCIRDFTRSKTRCDCELSTKDNTPVPDITTTEEESKPSTSSPEPQQQPTFEQPKPAQPEQQHHYEQPRQEAFGKDPQGPTTSATGLVSEILVSAPCNAQRPQMGQTVLINYLVWVLRRDNKKGRLLDDTYTPIESPVKVTIGKAPVHGLNEALLSMKVGQKSSFILPPHLVQGYQGSRYVTPQTSLMYEIELIAIV